MATPHGLWDLELPDQGSNPHPLNWKHEVLTTGPPGQSLEVGTLLSSYTKMCVHVWGQGCMGWGKASYTANKWQGWDLNPGLTLPSERHTALETLKTQVCRASPQNYPSFPECLWGPHSVPMLLTPLPQLTALCLVRSF